MKKLIVLAVVMLSYTISFSQTAIKATPVVDAKTKAMQAVKVMTPVTTTPPTSAATATVAPKVAPSPLPKAVPAPTPNDNPNAADFKFAAETHDFGNVPEGPEVKFEFEFTNTGKEPLVMQNVRASCGCTTPVWSKDPVMPGQTSKITVVYHTQGRPGPFSKTITITSNAKGGDKMVFIKGVVEKAPTAVAPEKAPSIISEPAK